MTFVVPALAAAVLYGLTAQRSVGWQDSGVFQYRILTFDLVGWLGVALSHPLMVLLAKAASYVPIGPLAWRMNMVSAIFGGVAVGGVVSLVYRLTGGRSVSAVLAGGFLAVAHAMWWLSTICESQAIHAALFVLQLHAGLSLVRRPSVATSAVLGLLAGLGLATHNLALLALPGWAVVLVWLCAKRRLHWLAWPTMAGAWLVGSLPWWVLVAGQVDALGWIGALKSGLFGIMWQDAVLYGRTAKVSRALVRGAQSVALSFPNLTIPLAAWGGWRLRRLVARVDRPFAAALGLSGAMYMLFAIRYDVADQFMFFLPAYVCVTVLAGLGLADLTGAMPAARGTDATGPAGRGGRSDAAHAPGPADAGHAADAAGPAGGRLGRRRWPALVAALSLAWTPVLYGQLPRLARALDLPAGRADLPYRDPARYWFTPWKHDENSARRATRAALRQLPAGATLIVDGTPMYTLRYTRQLTGLARSVRFVEHFPPRPRPEDVPVGTPDVFTFTREARYLPDWLPGRARLVPDRPGDVVYRVVWHDAPGRTDGSGAGAEKGDDPPADAPHADSGDAGARPQDRRGEVSGAATADGDVRPDEFDRDR